MFFNKKILAFLALCIGFAVPAAAEEINIGDRLPSPDSVRQMVQQSYLKKQRTAASRQIRPAPQTRIRPPVYPTPAAQHTSTQPAMVTAPHYQVRQQPAYQENEADRLLAELAAVRAKEQQQRKNGFYPF